MVLYVATDSNTHIVPILDVWPHIDSVFLCVTHMLSLCVAATVWGYMCHKKNQCVSVFLCPPHMLCLCVAATVWGYMCRKKYQCVSVFQCAPHMLCLCVAATVWGYMCHRKDLLYVDLCCFYVWQLYSKRICRYRKFSNVSEISS